MAQLLLKHWASSPHLLLGALSGMATHTPARTALAHEALVAAGWYCGVREWQQLDSGRAAKGSARAAQPSPAPCFSPSFAPRSVRRPRLTLRVNPGSLYRCGKSD